MQFRVCTGLLLAFAALAASAADKPFAEVQPGVARPSQIPTPVVTTKQPTGPNLEKVQDSPATPKKPAAVAVSPAAASPATSATKPLPAVGSSSVSAAPRGGEQKPAKPSAKPTIAMPTIGKPSTSPTVDSRALNQNVIYVGNQNEVVYVSSTFPNRISTPYAIPKIIDRSTWEIERVGQDVYVTPTGTEPITIYIVDQQPGAQTAILTLVPQPIPGQNISLVLTQPPRRYGEVAARDMATGHDDEMREIMRDLALSRVPVGYTDSDLSIGVARIGSVLAIPQKVYSGQTYNVFTYRIENVSDRPTELTEPSFWHEGVRAVSFWPNIRLDAGQSTNVFIVADKLDPTEQR